MKISIRSFSLILLSFIAFIFSNAHAGDLNKIMLPAPQTEIGKPLMQALKLRQSSRSFDTAKISMQDLSNILWAADGINRPESGKRTAPSAMNWQEIDIYVFLAQGTFIYDAKENSLVPVQSGDLRSYCGTQDFVKSAPLNLVYIADYARIKSNNDEDKKIFTAADCGFIAQNVYLYCASQGLAVVVRASIDRLKLAGILKLKADQAIILSQTVGYSK
jgi:SagB-type dehydrogenase family enzyme